MVRHARNLIFADVGVIAARVVALFVFWDELTDPPEDVPDQWVTVATVGGIVFAIGIGVLWVVLAIFAMRAARWARGIVTALCGLGVAGFLMSVVASNVEPQQTPVAIFVLDVIEMLLVVGATILLWTAPANRFFRAAKYVKYGWPPIPPG